MTAMSIKEQIAARFRAAGYDFLSGLEEAGKCIREFNESGEKRATYHIRGAHGRIADSFILERQE